MPTPISPALRGIGFLRLVRTGDEAGVERDILTLARDREAHLSRHRSAVARTAHDVRADRSRQSRRHRLRHVHRSAAARGIGSGAQIERAAGDRPRRAWPGDEECADLSGLSRLRQASSVMHAAQSGRHPETGDGRFPLCRVSRRRPFQYGARQIAAAAGQCRGLRYAGRSGQSAVQVGGTAGCFTRRCAGGDAPDCGRRQDVAADLQADIDVRAANIAVDRLPDRCGGPAACRWR